MTGLALPKAEDRITRDGLVPNGSGAKCCDVRAFRSMKLRRAVTSRVAPCN